MTEQQVVSDGIMDFTIAYEPIVFRINKDVFTAYDDLPALTLMEFSATASAATESDDEAAQQSLIRQFELVLRPESAALFIERMRDREHPIGLRHIQKVVPWLMEQFGLRPTEASSNSSTGSEATQDDGTNSTVSVVRTVSTSDGSPLNGSST